MNSSLYKIKLNSGTIQAPQWTEEALTLEQLKSYVKAGKVNNKTQLWDSINTKWITIEEEADLNKALFIIPPPLQLSLKKASEAPVSAGSTATATKPLQKTRRIMSDSQEGISWFQLGSFASIAVLLFTAGATTLYLHAGELDKLLTSLMNLELSSLLRMPFAIIVLFNLLGIITLFGAPEQASGIVQLVGVTTGGYLATLGWLASKPSLLFSGAATAVAAWVYTCMLNVENEWMHLLPTALNSFAAISLGMLMLSNLA